MAKILVIEDNAPNQQLIVYLLQAFGHTALTAVDGETGVEIAHRELPDLILCDIRLPKMDGYAVARSLRDHPVLGKKPIIAITAYAMTGDRERALKSGFEGYVPKPIIPETFVAQVESFLPNSLPPLPTFEPTPSASSKPQRIPTNGKKSIVILIVDNSLTNLQFLHSLLEPFGYRLIDSKSVIEAVDAIHQFLPDLVITDLHMPENDGVQLLEQIKKEPQSADIPVLILSSSSGSRPDIDRIFALGATKFISRPIEPESLLSEIEGCLPKK